MLSFNYKNVISLLHFSFSLYFVPFDLRLKILGYFDFELNKFASRFFSNNEISGKQLKVSVELNLIDSEETHKINELENR